MLIGVKIFLLTSVKDLISQFDPAFAFIRTLSLNYTDFSIFTSMFIVYISKDLFLIEHYL